MSLHSERALILLQQSRYDLAEKELRLALREEPDNGNILAMLALCLNQQDQWEEATTTAREAVRLAPDSSLPHHMLAMIQRGRDGFDEAEKACLEAIRQDPNDPSYFSTLASIYQSQEYWRKALHAADKGLELDPEHVLCLNARAEALTKLGRHKEASAVLDAALTSDPESETSHTNQGWSYLHQGNADKSLEHFREALRLEPNNERARDGLVEALRSQYFLYGLILRYILWTSRLGEFVHFCILLGAFVLDRVLSHLAQGDEGWKSRRMYFLVCYLTVLVLTFVAKPLFNLFLRFNHFGRRILSPDQRLASTGIGFMLTPAFSSLIIWLFTQHDLALGSLVFFGFLTLPVAACFLCEPGRARQVMAVITLLLAALFPLGLALWENHEAVAKIVLAGFSLGCLFSDSLVNLMIMLTARRS